MSESFHCVDLSRMLEHPKCAIQVSTEDEAKWFLQNAKEQFPERTANWVSHNNYGVHKERTCYTLFYSGDTKPTNLSYAHDQWFIENGYVVIQLSELAGCMTEIEESDTPLSVLLGCGER